jgi:hypothetical protein
MISQEESGITSSLAERRAFMRLPLEERRRIMAQQADQIAEHYNIETEQTEREHWQGGDIVEYQHIDSETR